MINDYCCVEITIVAVQKSWICYFNEEKTVKDNLREFYRLVKDEVIDEYIYSENLMCFDLATGKQINIESKHKKSGIYDGMHLLLF